MTIVGVKPVAFATSELGSMEYASHYHVEPLGMEEY